MCEVLEKYTGIVQFDACFIADVCLVYVVWELFRHIILGDVKRLVLGNPNESV